MGHGRRKKDYGIPLKKGWGGFQWGSGAGKGAELCW